MSTKILGVLILGLVPHLSACGSDARAEDSGTEKSGTENPVECTGFFPPGINIFVKDSLNDDVVIDTATVSVRSSDGESASYEQAIYVDGNDGLVDSLEGAYFSNLTFNSSIYEIGIVVAADGYHTFVTKGIEFELHTSCMASNDVVYEVYLCPLQTSCI